LTEIPPKAVTSRAYVRSAWLNISCYPLVVSTTSVISPVTFFLFIVLPRVITASSAIKRHPIHFAGHVGETINCAYIYLQVVSARNALFE